MANKKETVLEAVPSPAKPLNLVEEDDCINAGLLVTVAQHEAKKNEDREKRAKERAIRESSPSGKRLRRLMVQADTPYGVRFLHEFKKGIDLYVHAWRGDAPCFEICKVHYNQTCDICGTISSKFGEIFAVPSRCFIVYCYNQVGETFKAKNGQTYELNPVKLLALPLGKLTDGESSEPGYTNTDPLKTATKKGYFQSDVWKITRKQGKGFAPPSPFESLEQFQKLSGKQYSVELPDEALQFATMSSKQILKVVLGAFDNVQWELLGFKAPELKDPAKPTSELLTSEIPF